MMNIQIMSDCHVSQIADLEKLCFSAPWSQQSIALELNNELSLWLVAVDGDRVAGYVGSQSVQGESDMMNVAVHPDYRRRGIAELLIRELIRILAQKGNHCLTLEVRVSNGPATALYEKMGFEQVGLRRNYYRNPREDALILRKEFPLGGVTKE